MTKFLNGIGFASDLVQTGITSDGYATLSPGYVYLGNVEYYVFGSGQVAQLDASGYAADLDYVVGTPYFVTDNLDDIVQITNGPSVIATSGHVITDILTSGWMCNENGSYDFTAEDYAGKYLVYDILDEFTVQNKLVESATLVLSEESEGSPVNAEIEPVWIAAGSPGSAVSFYVKITDKNGSLLRNQSIQWYTVYTKPSGIPPDGVHVGASGTMIGETIINGPYGDYAGTEVYDLLYPRGTEATDSNGIARVAIFPNVDQRDIFVYAKCGTLVSQMLWIQTPISPSGVTDVFQLDEPGTYYSSQDAMTAVGMDQWGTLWDGEIADSSYDAISIDDPTAGTRGVWKINHLNQLRPPVGGTYLDDPIESSGYMNGSDFSSMYPGASLTTDASIIDFMNTKRVAVQGYWGQVIVTGAEIISGAYPSGHCLNPNVGIYTISASGFLDYDSNYGILGSWNDVKNNAIYNDWLFVLYAPGYTGTDAGYFTTHDFYFRGLALLNMNEDDIVNYLNQDYIIGDFISGMKLQQF